MIVTLGQGLCWAILAIGIYLTFRILDFPDMTAEGSFPLGGAVAATAITHGVTPVFATLLGVLAGMAAGLVTGLLFTKGKIPSLLAGILVMSSANSVILYIMKSPNLSLHQYPRLQDSFAFLHLPNNYPLVILGLLTVLIVVGGLSFFLQTDLGQAYIATGDNERMAQSLGIQVDTMKILGLVVSNGIIGLAGALIAQSDGYADINKGIGIIVIGLAAIIIGEVFFSDLKLSDRLVATVIGSILYQLLIFVVVTLGMDTTYLKLISAVILAICLMIPQFKRFLHLDRVALSKGGREHD